MEEFPYLQMHSADALTLEQTERILAFAYGAKEAVRHHLMRLAYDRAANPVLFVWAEENGQIVGYLVCRQECPKLWCYSDLLVAETARRRGIGSALLETAYGALSKRGGGTLYCYVAPQNTASQALQLRVGFQKAQTQRADAPGIRFEKSIPVVSRLQPSVDFLEWRRSTREDAYFARLFFAAVGKNLSYREVCRLCERENSRMYLLGGAPCAFDCGQPVFRPHCSKEVKQQILGDRSLPNKMS